MGDLFDEFKRELERRRAEAEGRRPPSDKDGGPDDDPDDRDPEGDADPDDESARDDGARRS